MPRFSAASAFWALINSRRFRSRRARFFWNSGYLLAIGQFAQPFEGQLPQRVVRRSQHLRAPEQLLVQFLVCERSPEDAPRRPHSAECRIRICEKRGEAVEVCRYVQD